MIDDPSQDPKPPEPPQKPVHVQDEERRRKPFFLWRVLKFVFKLVLGIFVFLIVLGGAAYLLVQTQWFHKFFQTQLLAIVNKQIGGTLEFDDYKLDLFKGIELYNVRLLAAGDTVISSPRANLRYSLEPLLVNSVVLNRAEFYSARIKILRSRQDSSWNVEHIGKKTPRDTAAPPDWAIHLRDVRLYNSTLVIHDSLSGRSEHGIFDPVHMNLRDLNLAAATDIYIRDNSYRISVVSGNFYDIPSQTRVDQLATRVNLDTTRTEVLALHLKLPRSEVNGSVRWDKFNVFGPNVPENILKAPVTATVNFPSLEAAELYKFVYFEPRFVGNYSGSATLTGSLTNMAIDDISIAVSNTEVNGRVLLSNVGQGNKFRYQVWVRDSRVQYNDVRRHMPDLDISAINNFGQLRIEKLDMLGSGDKLVSDVKAGGAFGSVEGDYTLNFGGKLLAYSADLDLRNFNLGAIVPVDNLDSRINGNAVIDGEGTSLDELTVNMRLDATNSSFLDRNFTSAFIEARTENKGIITVDTARFVFPRSAANVRYSGTREMAVSPSLFLSGVLDMRNRNYPSYSANINANNIIPSQLLNNDAVDAVVSGKFSITGRGFDPETMEGSLLADVTEFVLEDRALFPFTMSADLQRVSADRKVFSLTSPFADLRIDGKFGFGSLFSALNAQGQYFADLTTKKISSFNQAVEETNPQNLLNSTTATKPYKIRPHAPLDAVFSASIRDLSPLKAFIDSTEIHARGNLAGAIRGTPQHYDLVLDTSRIDEFMLRTPDTEVRMAPFLVGGSISTNNLNTKPELESMRLIFQSDSTITFGETLIQHPHLRLSYANDTANYFMSVGLNRSSEIALNGYLLPRANSFDIVMDSLRIGYKNSLGWTAAEPIRASLSGAGLDIESLKLHRREAELISVDGLIRNRSLEDLTVNVSNFALEDLQLFLPEEQHDQFASLTGFVDSATVRVNGTFRSPVIEADVLASELHYNGRTIGNADISLVHRNGVISGDIGIVNPELIEQTGDSSAGNWRINVNSLPYNLALASVPDRLTPGVPVDISLDAKRANLAGIVPFVPSVSRLEGYADANVSVTGPSLDKLSYSGGVTFRNTYVVLASTNIGYFANGNISLSGNTINIDSLQIRNNPNSGIDGSALITGNVTLDNFAISEVDITLRSDQLLVMSRATQATSPDVYGELVIGTGRQPLAFRGSWNEPYLTGDLNIIYADMTLPQSRNRERVRASFRYEFDTSVVKVPLVPPDVARLDTVRTADTAAVAANQLPNPQETIEDVPEPETDLLDRIRYDMSIRMLGRVFLNMELGTFDQLVAEIEPLDRLTPLRFRSDTDGRPKLFAELRVVEGSTYKFYRTFDATGAIYFTTGDIANPRLDLRAAYSGQRYFGDRSEGYTVNLNIQGTKEVPRITFDYSIAGQASRGDRDRIQGDALSLLAFGRTQTELGQSGTIGGIGEAGLWAFGSVYLSKQLTELFGGSRFIQDVGIEQSPGSTNLANARLRVTSQILGGVIVRYGGNFADLNTVTIDFPWRLWLNSEWANNFSSRAEWSTIPTNTVNAFRNQRIWELRPVNARWTW